MDPLRAPYTLLIYRSTHGSGCDVPIAKCRFVGAYHIDGNVIRAADADAPRYQYQYGHAAIQDDGGRHGEREAERYGLFYPVVPM